MTLGLLPPLSLAPRLGRIITLPGLLLPPAPVPLPLLALVAPLLPPAPLPLLTLVLPLFPPVPSLTEILESPDLTGTFAQPLPSEQTFTSPVPPGTAPPKSAFKFPRAKAINSLLFKYLLFTVVCSVLPIPVPRNPSFVFTFTNMESLPFLSIQISSLSKLPSAPAVQDGAVTVTTFPLIVRVAESAFASL